MSHPNDAVFQKLYADFAKGDVDALLAACPENVTFQIAGKSKLAGKYDRRTFASEFMKNLREYSGASFQMEVHDVLTSDRHALILCTNRVTRDGKPQEYRTVHVWRIEGGKPLAGYEYPRDMYQFDAIWG